MSADVSISILLGGIAAGLLIISVVARHPITPEGLKNFFKRG